MSSVVNNIQKVGAVARARVAIRDFCTLYINFKYLQLTLILYHISQTLYRAVAIAQREIMREYDHVRRRTKRRQFVNAMNM